MVVFTPQRNSTGDGPCASRGGDAEDFDGEFLVRNIFLSVDPAMRRDDVDKSTYWPRIEGDTMRAFSVER